MGGGAGGLDASLPSLGGSDITLGSSLGATLVSDTLGDFGAGGEDAFGDFGTTSVGSLPSFSGSGLGADTDSLSAPVLVLDPDVAQLVPSEVDLSDVSSAVSGTLVSSEFSELGSSDVRSSMSTSSNGHGLSAGSAGTSPPQVADELAPALPSPPAMGP